MSKLKVMLVDEQPERQAVVAEMLKTAGCEVVASLTPEDDLLAQVANVRPDVVIIDMESPGRDTLESLRSVQSSIPRPMVMFSQDDNGETIRRAVDAGVSAYIVDGIKAERVRPILEVAMARFEQYQALESELNKTRDQLESRKKVDRAKGILMKERKLSEEEAYALLRKTAMAQNKKISEIAEVIISAVDLLRG
jgi:two-component system, response regulator / RNA-binding antiterminator